MENKDKTRIENLQVALYERDRDVGEACKMAREVDYTLRVALDALRDLKGATPRDDSRRCVVEELVSVVIEKCRKYLTDHSNSFCD